MRQMGDLSLQFIINFLRINLVKIVCTVRLQSPRLIFDKANFGQCGGGDM